MRKDPAEYDRIMAMGRWLLNFVLIGVVSGLGAVLFHLLCEGGNFLFMDMLAGYHPPAPAGERHLLPSTGNEFNRYMLLVLPALGGLVSGWLVYTFAPEAEGHGTDGAIDAYHRKAGHIRGRVPIIKTLASAITLTSGGSGGREGPIAQIGAGFGSFLATRLKLSDRDRRIMLAAGMAAGVGSIFRAPLAGALFAAEVLYRDPEIEGDVIIPAGLSSVVAYCIFCMFFGWGNLFRAPHMEFSNPLALGPYTVLAVVLAGVGWLYVTSFHRITAFFRSLRMPRHLRPALGGLAVGVIGFWLPQTLGFGYGFVQMALDGDASLWLLGTVCFGKILTTSLTIGSGGSGGVFGPSVVIGGAAGALVGIFFHHYMPSVVPQPAAFVLVGMAGFFTGVSNTPISTIIFISEMSNSYQLLLPSLLVCSLTYLLSKRWTIYTSQVDGPVDSPAHAGTLFVDVLQKLKVEELQDRLTPPCLIPHNMTLARFKERFCSTKEHYFPVVNGDERMIGIFSVNDVREFLFEPGLDSLVVMSELGTRDVISTTLGEDLNSVLSKVTVKNIDSIPVVRDDDPDIVLGMLSRRTIIDFYNRRLATLRQRKEKG
ncbi:chloride channel protein, CIC family [Desulfomicrobium norvegicum]|uniref:Chloride channel protein, CIC family n=1 Tax=Desulfomicrobium norvegicum (strain DSM 1741 / NCIMB 8310) TaxID=52561 RepID=A0A8G2F7F8_DESNO|nr:chloride channel protein [Desulfomicrobium norvegicum]SFL53130.1 chloride channel protein, CIC family [Desulfomicrobium norvegicum]